MLGIQKLYQNLFGLLVVASVLLSACGSGQPEATPTVDIEVVKTEAVATFAFGQTQTALALPTETATATLTPTATTTQTPIQTATPATPIITGVIPTRSCLSLAYVADVTIPDNTTMTPSQKFTKTWKVRNNGSCAWEAGYKFNFTGGEAMGGSSITLQSAVAVGAETELSVQLTAPNINGTYRGNWRMTNAAGTYFGDEVYILIKVGGATATPTGTIASTTPTPTPTPTETPTEASTS